MPGELRHACLERGEVGVALGPRDRGPLLEVAAHRQHVDGQLGGTRERPQLVEPGQGRYYADRYYRPGSYYADRRLTRNERIYRGYDGRYYCRRNDGTTGLIVGAGIGALLGNQLNVGGSTTISTIIGGAAGALLGREITRGDVRCD